MFCTKCGERVSETDDYCKHCGVKIGAKTEKTVATTKEPKSKGFAFSKLFNGRLSRRNYWTLVGTWMLTVISIMFLIISVAADSESASAAFLAGIYAISIIIFIFLHISALVRRAHDMNKAGTTVLLIFIPLVGWAFGLWLALSGPVDDNNAYGEYDDRSVDFGLLFGTKTSEDM